MLDARGLASPLDVTAEYIADRVFWPRQDSGRSIQVPARPEVALGKAAPKQTLLA